MATRDYAVHRTVADWPPSGIKPGLPSAGPTPEQRALALQLVAKDWPNDPDNAVKAARTFAEFLANG